MKVSYVESKLFSYKWCNITEKPIGYTVFISTNPAMHNELIILTEVEQSHDSNNLQLDFDWNTTDLWMLMDFSCLTWNDLLSVIKKVNAEKHFFIFLTMYIFRISPTVARDIGRPAFRKLMISEVYVKTMEWSKQKIQCYYFESF